MKTVVRLLLIAVSVSPFLSISKAYAGPGYPFSPEQHRPKDLDLHPIFETNPRDIWSTTNRDQVSDDRMFDGWQDRFRGPGDPSPLGNGGSGTSAPLDGGISLLLAAGIGLGLKKVMRKNKSSEEDEAVMPVADEQI